jgi:AcrR family transcriptional regulator
MARSPTPRKARGQGRPRTKGSVGRQALIAAAREGLIKKPPGELTLLEIAQIAGVDPALIRYYFGQLPDLFTAAAIEITKDLRSRLAALIVEHGPVRDRLKHRILVYLEVFRQNPNYHRLVIDHVYKLENDDKQVVLKLLRQSVEELEDLVREGVQSGEFRPIDARFLQVAIGAMCEFFFSARPVVQAILGKPADDAGLPEHYAQMITDLVAEPSKKTRAPARLRAVRR